MVAGCTSGMSTGITSTPSTTIMITIDGVEAREDGRKLALIGFGVFDEACIAARCLHAKRIVAGTADDEHVGGAACAKCARDPAHECFVSGTWQQGLGPSHPFRLTRGQNERLHHPQIVVLGPVGSTAGPAARAGWARAPNCRYFLTSGTDMPTLAPFSSSACAGGPGRTTRGSRRDTRHWCHSCARLVKPPG